MYLKTVILIFTAVFWPLNLYLSNTPTHFTTYFIPGILVLLSFLLYKKYPNFFLIPILLIPIAEPKLSLFPLVLTFVYFLVKRNKQNLVYTLAALLIFVISFRLFFGQTIFVNDYEAKQQVIRDTQLYPSIILARTFHNKARIVLDKIVFNGFALVDPNNYFFGYHPRQLIGGQNLIKYPFITIVPFLYGLYYLLNKKNNLILLTVLTTSIFSLAFLTVFDGHDFILWVPIFLITLDGLNELFKNKKIFKIYTLLFLILLIPEILRIFLK